MAPKKGKGSKLARMSDEERARYLQHRAAIEEEARRRKQQLIESFIKNKLKREEAFTRLNVAKINQQWRKTLRVLKCKELQQDLDALHQWFDHTAEKKNHLVECLISDLQEAENQYSRVHQCHMETIEKLLRIFNARISGLQQSFEERRDQLFIEACNEMESCEMSAAEKQEHLQAVIFGMQESAELESNLTRAKHNARTEELHNQNLTELENLVNERGARVEALWADFHTVLQKHWDATEDRRREYLNLRHADEENCRQIFKYHQQIIALNETLSQLRNEINGSLSDESDNLRERTADKADCMQLFQVLRHKLSSETTADRRKLCNISDIASAVTKDLNDTFMKGQQILQVMDLCKKSEGRSEEDPIGLLKTITTAKSNEMENFEDSFAEEAVAKFSKLETFWNIFNKMSIEKEALFLQSQVLENEQNQLKSALKKLFSEYSSSKTLPCTPLTINRPRSVSKDPKSMALKGEKVTPHSGKTDLCLSENHSGSSIMHTLTIELAKS